MPFYIHIIYVLGKQLPLFIRHPGKQHIFPAELPEFVQKGEQPGFVGPALESPCKAGCLLILP